MLPQGTANPGPWRTPTEWRDIYAAASLEGDAYQWRYVYLPIASQTGKTEFLLNVAGHRLDEGPRFPVLYIGATEDMTLELVRDRVGEMCRSVPSLWEGMARGQRDGIKAKWINGVRWSFGWPSASQLSSRPVGLVILDELDRMPRNVGSEGSPLQLADARTKTYAEAKTIVVSSPTTLGESPIWSRFESGTMHIATWLCLGCGELFVPELRFFTWVGGADEARETARLACPHCGYAHEQADKAALRRTLRYVRHRMLADGELRPDAVMGRYVPDEDPRPRLAASFWFSGLVSNLTSWGLLAYKMQEALDLHDVHEIQTVTNTWFGEPYVQRGDAPTALEVLENVGGYERGKVPDSALVLTCGADVQKEGIWWLVRAWGYGGESWLVDWGYMPGQTAYDDVWIRFREHIAGGIDGRPIDLTLVDSGYRPKADDHPRPDHAVYTACRLYSGPGAMYPSKGYDGFESPVSARSIDYTYSGATIRAGVRLYRVDATHLKRWVHAAALAASQPGAEGSRWQLPAGTTTEYADHIMAEELVEQENGQFRFVVVNRNNHLLDCESLARAASIALGVDRMARPAPTRPAPPTVESRRNSDITDGPREYARRNLF